MEGTTILLVRHGQSMGNVLALFTGHSGYPLSELGHIQAAKTAEYIHENYKVDAVYSSDLPRAFQTAEHTAKAFRLPVVTNAGLREIDAGDWENQLFDALLPLYPDSFPLWRNDFLNAYCVGGESVREVGERGVKALYEIAEANSGKCIVVASHATTIRSSLWKISGEPESAIQNLPYSANCGVSELVLIDGTLRIVSLNYAEHLADLQTELPSNL